MASFKRKRKKLNENTSDTSMNNMLDSDEEHGLPYYLDKLKSIQKKMASAQQLQSDVEIKGTSKNPQIYISMDTARYEILKQALLTKLKDLGLKIKQKVSKDKGKATVGSSVKVSSSDGTAMYTVNFYNTTSSLLVNGIVDISTFLSHYEEIINNIPADIAVSANNLISDQCMAALQRQDERNQEPQVSKRSRSLSESRIGTHALSTDNCKQNNHTNTDPNRSMHPSADVSFSQCGNCKRSNDVIEDLMKKIIELGNKQDVILNRLAKAEEAIHQHLKGEFTALTNWMGNPTSRSEFGHTATSSSHHQGNNRPDNENLMEFSPTKSDENVWNKADKSNVKRPHTNSQMNKSKKTTNNKSSVKGKTPNTTPFIPENNIVITIEKTSQAYTNFSHDLVRRTVNNKYGPTLIEKINRYKFDTNTPRIIMQLKSPEAANSLIEKWEKNTFGGSEVRNTIDPKTLNTNVAMLKGVPIDADDTQLQGQVQSQYPGASATRLIKSGNKLRVFRVKFSDETQLTTALNQRGFLFTSEKIVCHFEKFNDG